MNKRIAIPLRKNRLDELIAHKGRVYIIGYDSVVAEYYRNQKGWGAAQAEIVWGMCAFTMIRPGSVVVLVDGWTRAQWVMNGGMELIERKKAFKELHFINDAIEV